MDLWSEKDKREDPLGGIFRIQGELGSPCFEDDREQEVGLPLRVPGGWGTE